MREKNEKKEMDEGVVEESLEGTYRVTSSRTHTNKTSSVIPILASLSAFSGDPIIGRREHREAWDEWSRRRKEKRRKKRC